MGAAHAGAVPVSANHNPVETSFGALLRDHLIERDIVTGIGNPNWSAFAEQLEGVHYETLRKAVAGERPPGPGLMEAVAEGLGVQPSVFFEYRLYQAQRAFDPKIVGVDQDYDRERGFTVSKGGVTVLGKGQVIEAPKAAADEVAEA